MYLIHCSLLFDRALEQQLNQNLKSLSWGSEYEY